MGNTQQTTSSQGYAAVGSHDPTSRAEQIAQLRADALEKRAANAPSKKPEVPREVVPVEPARIVLRSKKKDVQARDDKPQESASERMRRKKMAEAAEKRLRKGPTGKSKKVDKNLKMLFDQDTPSVLDLLEKYVCETEFDESLKESMGVLLRQCDEKTARESLGLLRKICQKIAKNPNEEKYRRLKMSNTRVQEDILVVEGALGLMVTIGFTVDSLYDESDLDLADFIHFPWEVPMSNITATTYMLGNLLDPQ